MNNTNNFPTDAVNSIENIRNKTDSSNSEVTIKRAKVDSLTIYEITESELQLLQNGSQSSFYLNICISSASFFVAFIISLLTTSFTGKEIIKTVFVCISVCTFIVMILYFIRWLFAKKDLKKIFERIKNRIQ